MIRALLLVTRLFLGLVVDAQAQSDVEVTVGGGYGSGGASGRLTVGIGRAGSVAAIRFSADGLGRETPVAPGAYQRRNYAVGLAVSREVASFRDLIGFVVGAGLTYGHASFASAADPDPFLLDNSALAIQLPIEAGVVIPTGDRVALTAGGYWSQGVASFYGRGLAEGASTSHGGVLLGLRLRP